MRIEPTKSSENVTTRNQKSATQEAIDRLQYQLEGEDDVDVDGKGSRIEDGEVVNVSDRSQRSELEFDGYRSIAEYDNDSYGLNVDGAPASDEELNFDDERPNDPSQVEENAVDPQDNRSTRNIADA